MAYAAVISLKHTMERLTYSSPEIITPLYKEVHCLQEILERSSSSSSSSTILTMNAIDERIRDAVFKFEDVFESHVSDQVASKSKSCGGGVIKLSVDLQNLKQEIDFFVETLKKMEAEYIKEVDKSLPDEDDDDEEDDETDFVGENLKIVGLSDIYSQLRDQLTVIEQLLRFKVVALVGMAGIGKTTLARKFYEDPLISNYFECRAWVKVGRKCRLKKVLGSILAQVLLGSDRDDYLLMHDEKNMGGYLKESLKGKRYLIVLDDVWDTNISVEIAKVSSYDKDGSRVLVTSRLQNVARCGNVPLNMRLLDEEESWDLLREKVFGDESCPYQLEKFGRKIAENCEGLPLTIIAVAENLSKNGERGVEYWSEVMLKKNHQVYIDAYKEISEVVFPSYDNLPLHLKACFLYMGVFHQDYCEISQSKLINMWISEGFLEPSQFQELEHYSKVCLNELISHNLVMLNQQSSISVLDQTKGVKTCHVHPSVWHLCNREARKNKFFHVLNYRADSLADGVERQHRLCIHNSILFGIKDVHESMVQHCASTARSLLCSGLYHRYQVPICFGLRLLRVLDALTIRMYEFPMELLELVQLRYLALTCDAELPSSISQLWNLHFLIVNRHLSIHSPSHLPIEIWDMKGLKHLHIIGGNLPHPNGAYLCHLDTLLNVSVDSCRESILKAIPNVKKLGLQILAPDVVGSSSSSMFDHISGHLHKLETLKCVVVNPEFCSDFVQSPFLDLSILPSSLNKLSLSGFGYPWECMRAIASLPNLRVLKLRCYAFQGPIWEIQENGFLKLQFLIIEDTDLERWIVGNGSFPWLCCLSLKHCYNLEEIHWEFGSGVFTRIEIEDCNPLGEACLKQIREARLRSRHYIPNISVHSSWIKREVTTSFDRTDCKRRGRDMIFPERGIFPTNKEKGGYLHRLKDKNDI